MSDRVVLLAVDGLDWNRVRQGVSAERLPALGKLLEVGAYAEVNVTSCVPGLEGVEKGMASPVLWTTVASGQYYFQHGVHGFRNILESVENPPLFESRHVKSPRVWDVLSEKDIASLVVGYYVTHPASPLRGVMVSDMFGEVESADVTWPAERCDELARVLGSENYAAYARGTASLVGKSETGNTNGNDASAGTKPTVMADILREFSSLTDAEISEIVNLPADDRRRSLIYSRLVYPRIRDDRFHRLFLNLLPEVGWRFATVYYRLIDFVSHGFWEQGLTLPEDYLRRYGQVVERAYAWIDRCVGEICERLEASDRLIVLSDHGFTASRSVPELATPADVPNMSLGEHAEPALLMVAGGARRGKVEGVSLLDIAPTILDFLGIPQSETLDGGPVPRLLAEDTPRDIPRVPEYACTLAQSAARLTKQEEKAVLERLAALGYIELIPE